MVTVVQLSDSHLQRSPADGPTAPDSSLSRIVDLAAALEPDLVLLTGDIADDGTAEAYRRVAEIVSRLGSQVLATPGNHDLRAPVVDEFGAADTLEIGGWRILTVDTLIEGEQHGQVDVDGLATRLGADVGTPTLLALHHPPLTTSTHPWFQLHGASELVTMLGSRGDVRIVTSGHLHEAFNVVLGDTSYIGCSSTWYSLKHRDNAFLLDRGHVGGLVFELGADGSFTWQRLPANGEIPVV